MGVAFGLALGVADAFGVDVGLADPEAVGVIIKPDEVAGVPIGGIVWITSSAGVGSGVGAVAGAK